MRAHEAMDRHDLASPSADQIEAAVGSFRLLADATRLRLCWVLSDGDEHDVASLVSSLDVARPLVSQHLAKLRLAGLVSARRSGRQQFYRLRGGHVHTVIAEALFHADHQVSGHDVHD